MQYTLRLHTDQLSPKSEVEMPACNRVVYVREGDAIVRAGRQAAGLAANSAWHGRDALTVTAGTSGATLLRWELVPDGSRPGEAVGAGVTSALTISRSLELEGPGGYLMRCDRVDFPLGGVAYTHVHRGPGIRCLLAGGIRVEVNGKAHDVAPGAAWFEAGPDPVRDGVVRWRCRDLQHRIATVFGVVLHERSVGKQLAALGFRRLSVRPQHPKSDPEAQSAFKKTSPKR